MEPSREATTTRQARPSRGEVAPQWSENDENEARTVRTLDGCLVVVGRGDRADAVIAALAARQRGRVSRGQLLDAGVSSEAITRRLHRDRLERVHRGIYAMPSTSEVPLADEAAALLSCGPQAALSHHSAATLWRLRPGRARPIHVIIPAGRSGGAPGGVTLHRSLILAPRDVRIHDGLPVTSPARTLLDTAITLPDRDIERLLDEALFVRRLVTRAQINDVLRRAGRHPGRTRLARVVAGHTSSTRSESAVAEKLLRLMRGAGLPEPRVEIHVLEYRLDFYWPELGLDVEVDAYGTHGSPARFEADRRRDARLLAEFGIVVIRLTKRMIEKDPTDALILVARAIGQREAALRSSPFKVEATGSR